MCAGHSKQGLSVISDLKNPGEQAGGHREEQRSVQPVPTTGGHSNPWPWDPTKVTKPLWACVLTGTVSSDERTRGQHPAHTGHSGNASSAWSKPLHCSHRSCKKHRGPELGIQGPHLTLQLPTNPTPHPAPPWTEHTASPLICADQPEGCPPGLGLPQATTVSSSLFVLVTVTTI